MKKFCKAVLISCFLLTGCGAISDFRVNRQLDLGQQYLVDLEYDKAMLAYSKALQIEPKAIVEEAMAAATRYDREIWDAAVEESLQKLKDGGAVITQPDDATLDSFRQAMDPIYEEYGVRYETLLNQINETLEN